MEFVRSAFYFLAVLSILVIVHEWGHFIVAKLCGMRVEDFSLFFGKRLIRLGERNGTEYNIRMIPLGGFVKIAGMEPDDISNGAPLWQAVGRKRPRKNLIGLDVEALSEIKQENVSDRIRQAVENAIGDDSRLSFEGEEELQALLNSSGINLDEHRYIELALASKLHLPDPDAYNQKPLWQRAAVIFAGPFMSLFFGYALFCFMGFTTGVPDIERIAIATVEEGKPAFTAGLRPNDHLMEINGKAVVDWDSVVLPIRENIGRPISVKVLRNDQPMEVTVTPVPGEAEVREKNKWVKRMVGQIGIRPGLAWRTYSPVQAVVKGTGFMIMNIREMFKALFSRQVRDNVGGPIAIAGQIHQDSKSGLRQVMLTGALLSVSLGVINLFPIPILDGGHLMLLSFEGIRRRRLSAREVYTAQLVGLVTIGMLFVLVMYNDLSRLFLRK